MKFDTCTLIKLHLSCIILHIINSLFGYAAKGTKTNNTFNKCHTLAFTGTIKICCHTTTTSLLVVIELTVRTILNICSISTMSLRIPLLIQCVSFCLSNLAIPSFNQHSAQIFGFFSSVVIFCLTLSTTCFIYLSMFHTSSVVLVIVLI